MSALDPYAQPVDRATQVGVDEYQNAVSDAEEQRKARALALQTQQANADAQQQAAGQKNALQTAGGDTAQWTLDPHYQGKSWAEAPAEVHQHFQNAYPEIQSQIPGMFNAAAETAVAPLSGNQKFTHYVDQATGKNMRFDPKTGTATPIEVQGAPEAKPTTDELGNPLTGDGALEGMDKNSASMAKQLANYEMPLTALSRIPAPQRLAIIAAAKAYEPTFDETQYNVRQAAKKDYMAGGKSFQNITAANTVMGHLNDLNEAAKGLDNFNSGGGLGPLTHGANVVKNWVGAQEGSPQLTKFNQVRDAVATELAKTFQGGAPHTGEVKSALENLSAANTPQQTQAAIQAAIDLVGSRLGELHGQYESAIGKSKDQSWLSPKSRAIIRSLGRDPDQIEPQAGTQQAQDPRIALAQQALNDPAATAEHKAAAKAILGIK